MRFRIASVLALLGVVVGVTADATGSGSNLKAPEASIPFANHGGIYDWQADRDQGLWVEDVRHNWYYAKLMGPCWGLDFAEGIGFDTRPAGTFDRFSAIIVPHRGRCVIQSLEPSAGPPGHRKANA